MSPAERVEGARPDVERADPDEHRFRHGDLAAAADRLDAALRRGRKLAGEVGDDLSPARIGLLAPLLDAPELGVGRLAEPAGVAVPTATRQLQQLDQAGVVSRRRDPALVTLTKPDGPG